MIDVLAVGSAVNGAISLTSRAVTDAKAKYKQSGAAGINSSLTDVASVARVEPLVMVDADCASFPDIDVVVQSVHSMFSGFYLQAVNLAGTINGVSVAQKLAPFNPNRTAFEGFHGFMHAVKSAHPFQHRLPLSTHKTFSFEDYHDDKLAFDKEQALKKEAKEAAKEAKAEAEKAEQKAESKAKEEADKLEKQGVKPDGKNIDHIHEAANLSVGKMFNVAIREDNINITVPIAIRLLVNIIPDMQMVDLFTFRDSFDLDMKERWHAWRSGRLGFFKDLVLCNDLIDKYRKAAIKDKSGITGAILNREANHALASIKLGNKVSIAAATNLAILSSTTLEQIETKLNGRFSNSSVRKSIFDNTNLMILAVVDKRWNRVTFYHRGLDMPSTVSLSQMKAGNKDSGTNVTDIMKAYMLGNAPQL